MLFAFLLVQGSIFSFFISLNVKTGFSGPPLQFFFGGNIFFWLIQLILIPSITMRLFSEEYRQGTIESLMTTPVYEFEIVSAKFFAALIVYTTL